MPGELEQLGQRLLGRGKDEGVTLRKQLSKPDRTGEWPPITQADAVRLMRYKVSDVLLLERVYEAARGRGEPEVVRVDRIVNARGVFFDADHVRALIVMEGHEVAEASAAVEKQTGGQAQAADLGREQFLKKWLRFRGVALPDLKRGTIERRLNSGGEIDPVARQVLHARLAVARNTTSKLEQALVMADEDGRLRHQLVYHGAHTGRWSGSGVQPQNLPRPHKNLRHLGPLIDAVENTVQFKALFPGTVCVGDAISTLVRPCFRAAPGHILCVADLASVEARGVAWCPGEQGLLDRFAEGADVYCDLATHIFGKPITREHEQERQIGKGGVLGCGFSLGPDKFARYAADNEIDLAAAGTSAEAVVEAYRDANPAIAGTKVVSNGRTWRQGGPWRDIEAAAIAAITTGSSRSAGRCTFRREDDSLVVQLPSGRRLYYRNARVENRIPAYCKSLGLPPRPKRTLIFDAPSAPNTATYGGKLTENVVQGTCRDLLAAALVECERQGLPVVLHVHDETFAKACRRDRSPPGRDPVHAAHVGCRIPDPGRGVHLGTLRQGVAPGDAEAQGPQRRDPGADLADGAGIGQKSL